MVFVFIFSFTVHFLLPCDHFYEVIVSCTGFAHFGANKVEV